MVIFNLISLLHHHPAGYHQHNGARRGPEQGLECACARRQLLMRVLLSKQLLLKLWPLSYLQPVQRVKAVRRPFRYNSKQILVPQLFSMCWSKRSEHWRCGCPPAVSTQLLVSMGRFCVLNHVGLQQLCVSDFSSFSPQTLTAKAIKCRVNRSHTPPYRCGLCEEHGATGPRCEMIHSRDPCALYGPRSA